MYYQQIRMDQIMLILPYWIYFVIPSHLGMQSLNGDTGAIRLVHSLLKGN